MMDFRNDEKFSVIVWIEIYIIFPHKPDAVFNIDSDGIHPAGKLQGAAFPYDMPDRVFPTAARGRPIYITIRRWRVTGETPCHRGKSNDFSFRFPPDYFIYILYYFIIFIFIFDYDLFHAILNGRLQRKIKTCIITRDSNLNRGTP